MSRPKGSRNPERDYVDVDASRCAKCNSTDREPYTNTFTQIYPGMRDGKPYNRIVRNNTACKNCGQARVDRVYKYVVEEDMAVTTDK